MEFMGNGEVSKLLAQRIATIDDVATVLKVMNAINDLTLCGFFNKTEYLVFSAMLERTRNYLMTLPPTGTFTRDTENGILD